MADEKECFVSLPCGHKVHQCCVNKYPTVTDCPICLEPLLCQKQCLVSLPCGHQIHLCCVNKYPSVTEKCPLCRNILIPQKEAEINRLVAICKTLAEQLEGLEHNRAWLFGELQYTRGKNAAFQKHVYDLEAQLEHHKVAALQKQVKGLQPQLVVAQKPLQLAPDLAMHLESQQIERQFSGLMDQVTTTVQAEVHRRGWDISDQDLGLIMSQTGASRDVAIETYGRNHGDLVNAILELRP
ncbi:MAG: RING finger domain-containing protein [Desulfosporosinus sp.]|nr:RING finger domain-containing protein [Desulfosporosinus sp.]